MVPVLNEEGSLEETLRSLRAQSFSDFELLVVDNGSTDRSPEIARGYADRVLVAERRGYAWAVHEGFEAARGGWVVSADADTLYPRTWLATMVRELSRPGVVAVFGTIGFREGRAVVRALSLVGYAFLVGLSRVGGVYQVGGANLGVEREAYYRVGGYPPVADLVGPDLRLVKRLARLGKVRYVPWSVCYTSNRRFAGRKLLPATWRAFRVWSEVALGREQLRWESVWGWGGRSDRPLRQKTRP
ncbi:MAG: glycosyltransferase [Candidatus Bipolaricaulota bacterium]|nr:glycosyltransferase [Candidatus Bipolaricaulota bacterium]